VGYRYDVNTNLMSDYFLELYICVCTNFC